MKVASFIVSALVLGAALPRAMGQTLEQFLAVYEMIEDHLDQNPRVARTLVRMSFHDAMGGVDAHLDMSNDEHEGLNRTFRFLNRLWDQHTGNMNNGTMGTGPQQGVFMGNRTNGNRPAGNRPQQGNGNGGNGNGARRNNTQMDMADDGDRPDRGDRNNTQMGNGGRPGRRNNTNADFEAISLEGLTKADFFAWIYTSAFYYTCRGHIPWVPLRFGRTTSMEAQVEDTPPVSEFGSGDHAAVLDYFEDHFGFNEGQVAVLMGAHTLGGATRQNSGFVGDWTGSPGVFNNEYYENLMFPGGRGGWEQIAVANDTKFEWRWGCNNRCRDLMLNVDMNMFYDLDDYFIGESGQVQLPEVLPATAPAGLCDDPDHVFADCFPKRTGSANAIVTLFEDGNNEMFLDNFALVFGDLLSRVKDEADLGYIAPPADWPAGIRMRRGRGRGGGQGGGPGAGPPGGNGGRPPRGCPDLEDFNVVMEFDNDIADIEGLDDEDLPGDFEVTGQVDVVDESDPEVVEDTTAIARAGDPFTRRLRASV